MIEIIDGAEAVDEWSVEVLQVAAIDAICEPNYQLFMDFTRSLGEVAMRLNLGVDLDGDS